jgi:hypothetical protein
MQCDLVGSKVTTPSGLWKSRFRGAASLGGGSRIEFRLMDEAQQTPQRSGSDSAIFGAPQEPRAGVPKAVWGAAALVVVVAIGLLVFAGRHTAPPTPHTLQPADPYAAQLPLSQLAMSESESLSGGKLTYLDGHIRNTGNRTVTGVTVQVVFANDEQLPPTIETLPLTLIRMKEPYIDTQSVGAAPIQPGEDREFRLTMEAVPDNWNQQMPQIRVIHVDLR